MPTKPAEDDPWKMLARCRAESARKDKKFKSELRALASELAKRCDYYTRELRRSDAMRRKALRRLCAV
jgi:hypothetical protein